MINLINVSNWQALNIGNKTCYSPNQELLDQLTSLPQDFWHTVYTEFACLIIDHNTQVIQLVRDHFGCEPFFYYLSTESLFFASSIAELVAVLKIHQIMINIDDNEFLYSVWSGKGMWYPTPVHAETIYQGIFRVKPAHFVTINQLGIIKEDRYWDLASQQQESLHYKNEHDYLEHFTELLHEGIRLQTGTNAVIAGECSGGLDSSSLVAATNYLQIPVNWFSNLDPHYQSDSKQRRESYFVELLCTKYGLPHHYIDAGDFNFTDVFATVTRTLGGCPQSLFSFGLNRIHQQAVNQQATVLLSGFGGDECVSGHASLPVSISQWLRSGEYCKARNEYFNHHQKYGLSKPDFFRQFKFWLNAFFPQLQACSSKYKYNQMQKKYAQHGIQIPQLLTRGITVDQIERMQLTANNNHQLCYRIEDSAIMARHYGFKYKYPLLYPKLVEFCNRLPLEWKREDGLSRVILRRYLSKMGLPEFTTYPITKNDGTTMGRAISKMKESYPLVSRELVNKWGLQEKGRILGKIQQLDTGLAENIKLYQNLLLQSLNSYSQEV